MSLLSGIAFASGVIGTEQLAKSLDELVIGQKQAKQELVDLSRRIQTGTRASTKTAMMLVYGPSGMGGRTLFESYAKIIGAPTYLVPVKLISQADSKPLTDELAKRLKADPTTVVIFKNFELVSTEVLGALLTVADNNAVGDGARAVKTDRALFGIRTTSGTGFVDKWTLYRKQPPMTPVGFMTASKTEAIKNLPTPESLELPKDIPFHVSREELIKDGVPQALLERCEALAPVFPPSSGEFIDIFIKHFNEAFDKFATEKRVNLSMSARSSSAMLEAVRANVYHPDISHDEIIKAMRSILDDALADAVLKGKVKPGGSITLVFDPEKLKIKTMCARKLKSSKGESLE